MRTELAIRFDYGVTIPWVSRRDRRTLTAVAGPHLLTFRTRAEVRGENMHSVAEFTLQQGRDHAFRAGLWRVLQAGAACRSTPSSPWTRPNAIGATGPAICKVKGKWRSAVMRSLLTLKGLSAMRPPAASSRRSPPRCRKRSAAPATGIIAIAGCATPPSPCWPFSMPATPRKPTVWQQWLMRVIAGAPEQLQTMYSVLGEKRLDELELPHLPGYENSRPVRIGNAAAYPAAARYLWRTGRCDGPGARRRPAASRRARTEMRAVFMKHLETNWRLPDEGIWEIRGAPQHFVHSKVMTWVAFDRASRAPDRRRSSGRIGRAMARQIHKDICKQGRGQEARLFRAGLWLAAHGCQPAAAAAGGISAGRPTSASRPRCARSRSGCCCKGLVQRYETGTGVDGLPPGEGAFLACSFWLADNYRLMGRRKEAMRLFNRLQRLANDVGLYAEEYDPRCQAHAGQFPPGLLPCRLDQHRARA